MLLRSFGRRRSLLLLPFKERSLFSLFFRGRTGWGWGDKLPLPINLLHTRLKTFCRLRERRRNDDFWTNFLANVVDFKALAPSTIRNTV
jgi:hypothetical protein